MESSYIYDLLEHALIKKWREEIEAKDNLGFIKAMHDDENVLKATLNEKQIELLKHFEISVNNYLDEIYYEINIKILNFGIKVGMQLQQAFCEQNE